MTFPTPNGTTNLGDPITDTGERRRRDDVKATNTDELLVRITHYLMCGGLVNPESMEGENVSDLLMECRRTLAAQARLREKVAAYREARWIKSESHKEIAQAALFAELDAQGDGK